MNLIKCRIQRDVQFCSGFIFDYGPIADHDAETVITIFGDGDNARIV